MGRLAPKGSVIEVPSTGADMSSFEDALDEEFCHIADVPGLALCGYRLADPEIHGVDDGPNPRCRHCGKLKCPDCEFIEAEL